MNNIILNAAAYPTHTPELAALFAKMNETRVAYGRIMRKDPFGEAYKASKAAYRAYWKAVDADKAAQAIA
jgi:hypothetical protein